MAVMEVKAVVCTDTERGLVTLTTAMAVMAVTAVATDTAMASNSFKSLQQYPQTKLSSQPHLRKIHLISAAQENDGCVSFKQIMSLSIFTLPSYENFDLRSSQLC